MALVLFLAPVGVQGGHDAGAVTIVFVALGLAQTVLATRALRCGLIDISDGQVQGRTLLRSASLGRDVATFAVVQRRRLGHRPYRALVLLGGEKPVLLREFSTGVTGTRTWLDPLAAQLNGIVKDSGHES